MRLPLLPPPHPPLPERPANQLLLPRYLDGQSRSLYAVAGAFTAIPLFQLAPRLWPIALHEAAWRYEAYSVVSGDILAPMAGLVLAQWVAAVENDRPVQGLLSLAGVVAGAALVGCAPFFVGDYLALRAQAPAEMRGAIDSAAWRALFAGLVGGVTLFLVGLAGWRAAHAPPWGQILKKGGKGGLVVGQTRLVRTGSEEPAPLAETVESAAEPLG